MVNILLGEVCVEIGAFDEAQEKLVHNLDVRPGNLEYRLIFFGVKGVTLGIHWRGDGAKEVLGEHLDNSWVHWLGDDLAVLRDVVQQLMQSQALDLLGLHVSAGVIKVEDDVALIQLLHKQLLASIRWYLMEARQLLQLALSLV